MSAHWKQRPEGGGWFAIWLIRQVARRGGRPLARACLYPITAYFLVMRGPERRASRDYLARVLGRRPRLRDVARHIHAFAATILDRVFMLSGDMRHFDMDTHGLDPLHAVLDRGQGALVFGSHLGSFDALRVLACARPDIKVRVVLDKAHNPAMTQLLDALNPQMAQTVIDAGQDGPSIVLAIQQATAEGEVVALLVDRTADDGPSLSVDFMGQPAQFPTAPWLIAAALKVPVVLAFGLYQGGARYRLAFEVFSERVTVPRPQRRQALAGLLQAYAARLEHHARAAPYNWFNFYDFWQANDATSASAPAREPVVDPVHSTAGAPPAGRDRAGNGRAVAARRAP